MIFTWFFKIILFGLKKFVEYIIEFHFFVVMFFLFLVLLFLVYSEFKKNIRKKGFSVSSRFSLIPGVWDFVSVFVRQLDKVQLLSTNISNRIGKLNFKTGNISFN